MGPSTPKPTVPNGIAPAPSLTSSVRQLVGGFREFRHRRHKSGLLKVARSTRSRNIIFTGTREGAALDGHVGADKLECPQVALSLWDRAYDALKEKDYLLVEEYEALLSKELLPASNIEYRDGPSIYGGTARGDDQYMYSIIDDSNPAARQAQMVAIAEGSLARLEEKATQYRIFGQTYILKDQITQLAKVVGQLKGIIGEAVKVSPQASVAWAGICVVIPLLINPSAEDMANRDGFAYVANRMGYYTALEPLLFRLLHHSSGTRTANDDLATRCSHSIQELYQHILEFQLRSIRHYYKHWLCRLARDTLAYDGWKQMQAKVKELEQAVSFDLSQINELLSRQELESLNKTADSSLQVLRQSHLITKDHLRATVEIRDLLSGKQQTEAERETQECHQTFRLARGGTEDDSYEWYKGRVEDRAEGTCEWFLKHDNFRSWLTQDTGPLLVSTDPGCGKSVLAKYLIDHMLPSVGEANICYFFFKDQDQNTLSQALCALLHQLFSQQPALIRHAMPKFAENGSKIVSNTKSLWDILKAATEDPAAEPTTFVLDALDECVEADFRELMQQLTALFVGKSISPRRVKFLLTGRPYSTVLSGFQDLVDAFPYVRIPGENESDAISKEVDHVIKHRVRKLRLLKHIEDYLEQRLAAVDHRTYLWVYLVFDYLESEGFQKTTKGIDLMLQNLPTTVNQAYEKILAKHRGSPLAQKTLSIILAASRPLTVAEMNVAVSVNRPSDSTPETWCLELESEDDFRETLPRVCGLFVSIYHDRVYFLHQTAREFLLATPPSPGHAAPPWENSITMCHAHTVLAEACVVYLRYFMPDSSLEELYGKVQTCYMGEESDDQHPPFLGYSAKYWGTHLREAAVEPTSVILSDALRICDSTSKIFSAWTYMYRRHDQLYIADFPGLAIASRFGLADLAALLLAKGADVDTVYFDGSTALHMAVSEGNKAVVDLLIRKGAAVNTLDSFGQTPLHAAAGFGYEDIVGLLLANSADVEGGGPGVRPLEVAAVGGHMAVVQLLVANGADIEGGGPSQNPLQAAADAGHKAVVELLVVKGADVNAKGRAEALVPLQYAAKGGYEGIVNLLLTEGADVEGGGPRGFGESPLQYAAKGGYESIVDLLLTNGANIEGGLLGETPLQHAAKGGHKAIAELLVVNGAQVNPPSGQWRLTPLQYAAKGGFEGIVDLLRTHGADIEGGSFGETPLKYAAKGGHEAIVGILIAHGAKADV